MTIDFTSFRMRLVNVSATYKSCRWFGDGELLRHVINEAIISSLLSSVSDQAVLLRLAERRHDIGKKEAARGCEAER